MQIQKIADCLHVKIEARIRVATKEELGRQDFLGVRTGTRLGFFRNGLHHDGEVVKCDKIVAPGDSGVVTFRMFSAAILDTDVTVGSVVELKRGHTVVAVAEVLRIEKVEKPEQD